MSRYQGLSEYPSPVTMSQVLSQCPCLCHDIPGPVTTPLSLSQHPRSCHDTRVCQSAPDPIQFPGPVTVSQVLLRCPCLCHDIPGPVTTPLSLSQCPQPYTVPRSCHGALVPVTMSQPCHGAGDTSSSDPCPVADCRPLTPPAPTGAPGAHLHGPTTTTSTSTTTPGTPRCPRSWCRCWHWHAVRCGAAAGAAVRALPRAPRRA